MGPGWSDWSTHALCRQKMLLTCVKHDSLGRDDYVANSCWNAQSSNLELEQSKHHKQIEMKAWAQNLPHFKGAHLL